MKCRWICFWILLSCSLLGAAERETWLVHYTAEGNGFVTGVNLINGDFSADYQVTLEPFAIDGTMLEGASFTVAVPRGKRVQLTREDLNWVGQPVSHVRILGDDQVRVHAVYRAEDEAAMSAAVAGVTQAVNSVRFTPSENNAYFDGLVLTNTLADVPIEVDLSAHDDRETLWSPSASPSTREPNGSVRSLPFLKNWTSRKATWKPVPPAPSWPWVCGVPPAPWICLY